MVRPAAPFLAILSQRPGESAWWAASQASHASVDSKLITGSGSDGMRAVNHDRPTAPGRAGSHSRRRGPPAVHGSAHARASAGRYAEPAGSGAVLDHAVVSCIFASVRTAADD